MEPSLISALLGRNGSARRPQVVLVMLSTISSELSKPYFISAQRGCLCGTGILISAFTHLGGRKSYVTIFSVADRRHILYFSENGSVLRGLRLFPRFALNQIQTGPRMSHCLV